jgi:hypothetical protein
MSNPRRWREAEQDGRQRHGGGPERAFPIAANTDPEFPITRATVRKVDCPVDLPDGGVTAVEIKMYGKYRTIVTAPGQHTTIRVEVPLSTHIKQQIAKDVAARKADASYHPLWEFLGAGPSPQLRAELLRARIVFVEYH